MIDIDKFAKEIRKQFLNINKDKKDGFNFLGFVELEDLTGEVESYFKEVFSGRIYYNWISGNTNLQCILKKINIKTKWQDIKKLLLMLREGQER